MTELDLNDPRIADIVQRAETAFLATMTPGEMPDVSHRGGPPGFLKYDAAIGALRWTEYLGNGMFASLGNIRATGIFSLLVLDLRSGDALVLHARGQYTNLRTSRQQRDVGLMQADEPYPVQGVLTATVTGAELLQAACHPRQRINAELAVTACSSVAEQRGAYGLEERKA